ncbi:hypothetical protein [Desulfofalx alkaliphila]|uniref:hypothetical protein n=1 Tax=Desulfofalx alkaliphila TaxID=105483 RepID=UPI0004E252AB|nr:hypothetical protein [Desulfofalx alkaliphila]
MIIVVMHKLKRRLLQALRLMFVLAILILLLVQLLNVIKSTAVPGDIKNEQPGGMPVRIENILPVHRHDDNCQGQGDLIDKLKDYYRGSKSGN